MELFHQILKAAVDGGTSDVHIKEGAPVVFRINRRLVNIECPVPTQEWLAKIIERTVPPHLKKSLEEDREADFSYVAPGIGRFRTSVYQQSARWALSMRFVKAQVPDFEALGLSPVCKTLAESPRGIVLLAGTTGCGKSTTLAAMVEHINANLRKHIITLEDPIEYVFEDNQSVIEQREVGLDTRSFGHGLKTVLRQGPDVIMIGEMRDAVSFQSAMSAADTGHLVLSTLHTTNASTSIGRILDFFKNEERDTVRRQIANTLRAVICQRMVPTVDGKVTPAQEILINTPMVRKFIEENKADKLGGAMETGKEEGMQSFNQAIYELVKAGRVSKEDAMERATNPQALEMMFQGIFLSSQGGRILG